jgi:hypothetical protein
MPRRRGRSRCAAITPGRLLWEVPAIVFTLPERRGRRRWSRLVELAHEVDSAVSVFARDDWTRSRADPEDLAILDGCDDLRRAERIAERLAHWKALANA